MQPTSWAGSCGLRPLPSWKPQGGEGRGGEKRRREERSRHGALESSQGCQMPDAGHLLLYLGNRQLLGLSVATMVTLTYFGAHFAVIRRASLEKNPYQAVHQWAFSAGLSLVGLLTLGAVLSAAGTVREAQGLMAGLASRTGNERACWAERAELAALPKEAHSIRLWLPVLLPGVLRTGAAGVLETPQPHPEHVAASPRSPASSDAPRVDPHIVSAPKQMLLVQEDTRVVFGGCRTMMLRLGPSPTTCLPTELSRAEVRVRSAGAL
ncbi:tetraspanin-32 isoform X12 [Papio anubis]|uniref:tetraspanin-32 isoform X12 n=1 Tax=Papio anubis TaxID=9555 RepID=UPI0012ADADEC|nr:tetraspanin-32 isoform X12 [Papio anubis]